jgi:cell division protein FtsQ
VADKGGKGPGRTPGRRAAKTGAGARALVVDPRMRSRRIRVRRSAGRRRLKRVTLVLAGVAIFLAASAATQTSLLDVDRVLVTGVDGTRAEAVRSAAAVAPDQPLVSLDTGAVAGRVEALPWVESAQVSRSWPATVRVRVTAREVVAAVQVDDAKVALVDAEGYVVVIEQGAVGQGAVETPDGGDDAGGGAAGALVLTGIEGPVAEGRRLDGDARDALTLAVAVNERMPDMVASVSTDLDAELVAGGVMRFGSTEDLDEKLTAVKTVLSDVDTACMAVLDVRVPGSPALTRNQGCS